jgi:hypothetical protein
MKVLMIILCCLNLLFFSCSKESFTNEFSEENTRLEISQLADSTVDFVAKKRIKTSSCEYQLFGFADFPFQSIVIDETDYPFCTDQLCVLIESAEIDPYFSIKSEMLKICKTGFESMNHHSDCADFSPTQITYLNYSGGTELQVFFPDNFWNCFFDPGTYPGMEFQLEHGQPFI